MPKETDKPATPRRYDSLRRLAQAKQTRTEIASAARALFLTQGWAATTVRDIAREAGVSVPTVYAAYQNKSGLVWALVDAADLTAGLSSMVERLEAATAPKEQIRELVSYDRRLYERAGDLITLVREAGRTEPDLSGLYQKARGIADQTRITVFSAWPQDALRTGLDIATATDIYAALCNIDVYTMLIAERQWPPERIESWWTTTLSRELLNPQYCG